MEKIIKKLFFGTSALTLAAVALLPLASGSQAFAATQAQQSSKFSVTVNPTLTIDSVTTPAALEFSTAAVKESNFSVFVSSNKNYVIQLSAEQPALVSSSNSSHTIPATANVSTDQSGWGIKKANADGTAASAYTAITTTPTTFYTGTIGDTNAKNKETNFKYGIGVASGQPSGTYSTTVTVTATTAN